jgi:hypothetical protein
MKKIFSLFLFITSGSYAQLSERPIHLSEQAEISVVTCGPFQGELYSAFGHSAFRVADPALGFDVIYNYGIFDYDQPNFYLNFALGKNKYMCGLQDYNRFRDVYIYYNRFIHEQKLNLNQAQKQKLFSFLEWNARPENRDYYYDYFYDNCATKIRDVMLQNFGDSVRFNTGHITTDYSIRELTDMYLQQQPWGDLGIDIGLGLPMDKKAAPLEYMFLPDYVEAGYDHATIKRNGADEPLVKEKVVTYESREEEASWSLPHPLYVFIFIAVVALVLTIWDIRRNKLSTWFDSALFTTAGLIGILLLFLWFFTDHKAAANNFNLLWAFPAHIVAGVVVFKRRTWTKYYFLFALILSALTLLVWPILPQKLHYALIPVVITLAIRAFAQYYKGTRYELRSTDRTS